MSMAASTLRAVMVDGENADGVIVDQDSIDVDSTGSAIADRMIAEILQAQTNVHDSGGHLASTGVALGSPEQVLSLREALPAQGIENVVLVSTFSAAAALTRAAGSVTGDVKAGLLFVEPEAATLAVIDTADGSIGEIMHRPLPRERDAAIPALAGLLARADGLDPRPDAVLVVGSEVDVTTITPALQTATTLPVRLPAAPEMALATGAALASAHAPLLSAPTSALAWAHGSEYVYAPAEPVDYEATGGGGALAYSALQGETDNVYLPAAPYDDAPQPGDAGMPDFGVEQPERKPFMLVGSALAGLFVVGVSALAITLALDIRPAANVSPGPDRTVVVPTHQAPAPPPQAPPPPPAAAPPEQVAQPAPAAHQSSPEPAGPVLVPVPAAPAPEPVVLPQPAPVAPAPAAEAPPVSAAPPAPAAPPVIIPLPVPVPVQLPAPTPIPAAPHKTPAVSPSSPVTSPQRPAPVLPPLDSPRQSPKSGDSDQRQTPSKAPGKGGEAPSRGSENDSGSSLPEKSQTDNGRSGSQTGGGTGSKDRGAGGGLSGGGDAGFTGSGGGRHRGFPF
jgi:hypothetical protein